MLESVMIVEMSYRDKFYPVCHNALVFKCKITNKQRYVKI